MSCVIPAGILFQWLHMLDRIGGMGDTWYVNNNIIGLGHNSSESLAFSD